MKDRRGAMGSGTIVRPDSTTPEFACGSRTRTGKPGMAHSEPSQEQSGLGGWSTTRTVQIGNDNTRLNCCILDWVLDWKYPEGQLLTEGRRLICAAY
jgi:hypothetical protein